MGCIQIQCNTDTPYLVWRYISAQAILCYMGTQTSPLKGAQQPPSFWPMSIMAKWSPISATAEHLLDALLLCLYYEDCSEQ